MDPVVREPTPEDGPDMGRVHVETWQAAYRGDVPDEYLDALSADERGQQWAGAIAGGLGPRRKRLVTDGDDGRVSGLCMCGPAAHDGASDSLGEIYLIYVHPDHWDSGAGRALMIAGLDFLRSADFTEAVLWVLPTNDRAKRFYERGGWVEDGITRVEEILGLEVPETRYSIVL